MNRRTVLRGMLGGVAVAVAVPPLESLLGRRARAETLFPKRFGIWFWGNGVLPDKWVPPTEGADWKPSPLLMPLAPLAKSISVVSGMRLQTTNSVPHGSGPSGLLAGDDQQRDRGGAYPGPTIDQIIAKEIGGQTRFPSLEVGVQRATSGLSHAGPTQVNPPETNPRALHHRLFVDGFRAPGEMSLPDPKIGLRRSVLDAVTVQSKRLQSRVSAGDKARLEQHLDGVRALEMRLERLEKGPPDLKACTRPNTMPAEDYPDVNGRAQMSAVSRVVSDLVVMALACDQTRVFSNMFSQPVSNVLFPKAPAGHHQLTHDEPGEQPEVHAILVSIIEELAYFLEALRKVREGDGTLLDHCLVLATTDCSLGRTHSLDNYPILLCGSGGGAIKTGLHVRSRTNENACKVSLTLLRAMGVQAASFGFGAGKVTDGVGALTA